MKLKRGSKIWLSCCGGEFSGPFKWTLVREWVALKFVSHTDDVRIDSELPSHKVGSIESLVELPPSRKQTENAIPYYLAEGRERSPSVPRQHAYLKKLGCPFETSHFDKYVAMRLISELEEAFPEKYSDIDRTEVKESLNDHFVNGPATEKQVAYLRSSGKNVASSLTKKEAARLISGPASEGQLRRLFFYQISYSEDITKWEAERMIDDYILRFPESEEKYQTWKRTGIYIEEQQTTPAHEYNVSPELKARAEAALRSLDATKHPTPSPKKIQNQPWWKFW